MSSRIHEPLNAPFVSSLTPEQVHCTYFVKIIQIVIRDYIQVASWGIIKMNDYLVSGTRQQYWEEFFVKHVMSVSLVSSYKESSNLRHKTYISVGSLNQSAAGIILWGTSNCRVFNAFWYLSQKPCKGQRNTQPTENFDMYLNLNFVAIKGYKVGHNLSMTKKA